MEAYKIEEAALRQLANPVTFLKNTFPGQSVFRFILTHPDMDHMRGLANLFQMINVVNFWDTNHTKAAPDPWKAGDGKDWTFYESLRAGGQGIKTLRYTRGVDGFAFSREQNGQMGGDAIEILSPTAALVADANKRSCWNDHSIVLRISYAGRSVLLAGDAEAAAWAAMKAHYGQDLRSDVLKASHHGRDSGFDREAVKLINPRVVVASVGRKPATDAHTKYKQICNNVLSTRYYGNLHLQILPDGEMKWSRA